MFWTLQFFFFIFWIYFWISFTSLITSFGILNLGGISISCCNSSYIISSFYGSSWYYFPEFQQQLQVIFCACVSRPCQVSSMILFNTVLVGSWGLTIIVLDKIFPSQIFGHFMVNFLFYHKILKRYSTCGYNPFFCIDYRMYHRIKSYILIFIFWFSYIYKQHPHKAQLMLASNYIQNICCVLFLCCKTTKH